MKKNWILLFIAFLSFSAQAQKPEFYLNADTSRLQIGEQAKLTLSAKLFNAELVEWPTLPDTISGLVIVDSGKVDTVSDEAGLKLLHEITITSFDSGYVVIPELKLVTSLGEASSKRLIFEINSPELKEEQDYFDIKDPLKVPISIWEILKWALLVILAAALVYAVVYFIGKRNRQEKEIAPETQLPPHVLALQQLEKLEAQKLWQEGKIKLYYSQLVDIMRLYMERQFAIKAMESTSDELTAELRNITLTEQHFNDLKQMLFTSSMVKYAKEKPLANENEKALSLVKEFITNTKPKEEEENAGLSVSKS